MAEKSIKKNYLYNLSYQILLIIVPLVTAPYVSRVLGADGIGLYSYAMSIATYFISLATLGTSTYGQREISYHQSDPYQRSVVFFENVIIRLATTAISLSMYALFLSFSRNLEPVFLVVSINILSVAVDITWFFQGLEEFGKVVGRNFFFRIANVVFLFVFVRTKADLIVYALGICGIAFLANISLFPFLSGYLVRVKMTDLHPISRISTILSLFIPTIAIQVYTVLDKTMIGVITSNTAQNGYYEQSQRIATMALTLVTALGTVMVPRIGSLFAASKTDEVSRYMLKSYRFVWFLATPLAFGVAACAANLVPWFFGDEYYEVISLLHVFSLQIVAIGLNNVTGIQYLVPTGRQNSFTKSVCSGAVLNFIMNLLLIPRMAAIGAAISSVCAESLIVIVQLFMVRKELNVKAMVQISIRYLLAGSVMFAIVSLCSSQLSATPVSTLLLILIGASVYMFILAAGKDEMFNEIIRLVRRLIDAAGMG